MKICKQYKDLLQSILANGVWREDPNREGTKRLQIPFTTMSIDLREGFPMLTTKKMWWKGIVVETLWLLKGESNIKYLVDNGINIWNKDAYNYYLKVSDFPGQEFSLMSFEDFIKTIKTCDSSDLENWWEQEHYNIKYNLGDIGRMYGVQWRSWKGLRENYELTEVDYDPVYEEKTIDQLQKAIDIIKTNPLASNIRIFGDNPADAENQALPCCMDYMQFSCEPSFKDNLKDLKELATKQYGSHVEMVKAYKKSKLKGKKAVIDILDNPPKAHYLDLTIHYRSWDVLLGAPWNIAQYALILEIIAKITNKIPRNLNIVANNVHLYDNQIEAAKEQIERDVNKYDLPKLNSSILPLSLNVYDSVEIDTDWFRLEHYKSYPKLIKQPEMISYE